ncbi:MAG: hypothetical protein JXR81_08365 [Candidatus Goldbacteria bacterium]|nr:hypothetical protein [Candidatus Goldiibacteriota bacterium]
MKRIALIIASAIMLVSCAANKGITVRDDRGNFTVPLTKPSYSYTVSGSDKVYTQSSCGDKSIAPDNKPVVYASPVQDIIIDGIKNEIFSTEPVTITGKNGNFVIYFGTGNGGLYVFADIADKTPGMNNNTGKNIKNGDALEIIFSTALPEPNRTILGVHDHRVAIKASENPEGYSYTLDAPLDRGKYFYKKNKSGYTLEAVIPWHNFKVGCLCGIKNRNLSFDIAVIDADKNSLPVKIYPWSKKDDYRVNPSRWGYVFIRL